MGSDWLRTTIGEQLTLQRGVDITRAEQRVGKFPVISSGGISSFHDTAAAKGPGVVLGRKGVVGSVWYSPDDYWPHDTTLWVKDFKGNDPRFVYYFFKDRSRDLARLDVGSANPTLNRNHVHPIAVLWPSLSIQRDIAHALGSLDDKIELNRQMNETLEAMARALFKSWFVDFDPVHAKAAGRAPTGMDAETAKLFPSEFIDSDLGPIPKGWRAANVGEVVELAYGKALRKDLRSVGSVPVYGSGGQDGSHTEALVVGPGVVVGRKGTVGSVYWVDGDFFPIDTTFFVRLIGETVSLRWVYEQLRTINIASLGADSAVPGVNRNAIYAQRWVLPRPEAMTAYEVLIAPFVARQRVALQEIETLVELRDELLPRLLSGELRVNNH